MSLLSQSLYWITSGLLVPTVCLLMIFAARALILAGAVIADALDRRRYGKSIDLAFTNPDFSINDISQLGPPRGAPLAKTFAGFIALGEARGQIQRLLAQLEILHEKRIAEARLLARVGPMLGLMGTLIPLGPALLGLAEGDLGSLAENMLVAFATTVVGLLIGGIGFTLQQTRQRWAAEDIARAEFAASLFDGERKS